MLVSCSYCNGRHKRGHICEKRPKRKGGQKDAADYINRFRSSRLWKNKRAEIKERDKYLCQACLLDNKYTFQNLEVHHIVPISKNWNKRLENENLITLCIHCHKMAEKNEIEAKTLLKIAEKRAHV